MFNPAKYLGQPVPDLIDDLARLDLQQLQRAEAGQVEPYSSCAGEASITCRPATLLADEITEANLPADHPDVTLPGVILEDYLGGGGQGWVYLGRVIETKKLIAVKVLRSDSSNARATALREATLCSRVRHPNLLRVFENKQAGAFHIILMEMIQGKELSPVSVPAENRKSCFAQLSDALAALHREQIVHCDVKPANILMRSTDQTPVLVDFGVAQDVSQPRKLLGLSGTPYFMAPDVFRENIAHPAWDAYSLGVTASVLVIGKQHGYTNLDGIQNDKMSGRFDERLRDAVAGVESEFAEWIATLIDSDKAKRLAAIDEACGWVSAA